MKFTLGVPSEIAVTTHIDDLGDIDLNIDGIPVLYIRHQDGVVMPYCITGQDADRLAKYGFKLTDIGGGSILTRYEGWSAHKEESEQSKEDYY